MKQLLFVCTTPRTGSSMLRGDIRSTNAMGDPREWFNMGPGGRYEKSSDEWAVPAGDLDAYIAAIREHTATPNGVVGVKIFELHLSQLVKRGMLPAGPGRLRALAERFGSSDPVIVRLSRDNKLRQAISFVKARQTGKWGSQGEAKRQGKYDRKAIESAIYELIERENLWDRELEASGYSADVTLVYETLQNQRSEAILSIARALGLPDAETVVGERDTDSARLERQANDETEAWIDRFIGWK